MSSTRLQNRTTEVQKNEHHLIPVWRVFALDIQLLRTPLCTEVFAMLSRHDTAYEYSCVFLTHVSMATRCALFSLLHVNGVF